MRSAFFKAFVLAVSIFTSSITDAVGQTPAGYWSGRAILDDDTTAFYLNLQTADRLTGWWGLPEAGPTHTPFSRLAYDPAKTELTGDGDFLRVTIRDEVMTGTMLWHGKTADLLLERTKQPPASYTERDVTFSNGDITLAGTVIYPNGDGPHPAVVFVHGSGAADRWWAFYLAEQFTKAGFAGLMYDKRGVGDSGGDWTRSSLHDLAGDALAAVRHLSADPRIDPGRIGLYGISQGGWVAAAAGADAEEIDFMIVNSGGGLSPVEVETYAYETAMREGGLSDTSIREARQLLDRYFAYLRDGGDRDVLAERIEQTRDKPWYPYVPLDRILPSEENRPNWRWVGAYDPIPDIARLRCPLLLLFGAEDTLQPTDQSVARWQEGLKRGGNSQAVIKIFPDVGHGIRVGAHGHHTSGWPRWATGFIETQIEWLKELGAR